MNGFGVLFYCFGGCEIGWRINIGGEVAVLECCLIHEFVVLGLKSETVKGVGGKKCIVSK